MARVRDSIHFVDAEEIPRIDTSTPFREVYKELARRDLGGFLLLKAGRAVSFVRGFDLAQHVVGAAADNAEALRLSTNQPIGQVVEAFRAVARPVPVARESVDLMADETPLRNQPEAAISVLEGTVQIGWFLNHERVLGPLTSRTIFICARGHRNTDPDSGSCWQCPAPIVRTEEENRP